MKLPQNSIIEALRTQAARFIPSRRRGYSLHYLDKKLEIHIKQRNGIFLEAGGNDGIAQSNTLYFEKYFGWKGILVEPIPRLAELCRSNRRSAIVVEAALVADKVATPRVTMSYCNLMSLVHGARGSIEADAEHLERGLQFLGDNERVEVFSVPTTTLSSAIAEHGNPHINLLSLDVEGFEANALAGLDLARHRPDWILVEANDRVAVEKLLLPLYAVHDYLSFHDILYRRVR